MTPLFVLLALVVVGGVAVVAGGRGGGLDSSWSDHPGPWLPTDRPVVPADIDAVHFGVGFRGYRMDEVDLVLDRLATELRDRDVRIAELEGTQASPESPVDQPGPQSSPATPRWPLSDG